MKLLIGLIVLAFYLFARKAKPASDQAGTKINAPSQWQETSKQLTIASYNVQTGKDVNGKRDIKRSADVIINADIVSIQEVYAQTWLNKLGIGDQQTLALAKHGGFGWLFAATRRRWFREHRGNALLSRLPIDQWQIKMLPDQSGKSYRNMVIAKLNFNKQPLWLINTHLHTRKGKQQQLKVVINEFNKYPTAILMGDFNSSKSEPLIQELLNNANVTDAIGALADSDDADRIDWIFTKGLKVSEGQIIPKGVSDHPYYQVNIQVNSL